MKDEMYFWVMINLLNWKKDHDYKRIQKEFKGHKKLRLAMQKFVDEKHNDLDVKFNKDWLADPGIEVSDDGWSDLRAEVVGRGKLFYDNITVKKLQKMALKMDYEESFLYSFH